MIRPIQVMGVVLTILGTLLSGYALVCGGSLGVFVARSERVWGSVVDVKINHDPTSSSYSPIFEFRDAKDETHRVQADWTSYAPMFEQGQPMEIYYVPSDPKQAKANFFWRLWGPTVMSAVFGVPMLLAGLWMWRWAPGWIRRFWPENDVVPVTD